MFEFLRNLTKSDSERRQEILSAYLDDSLTPPDRERFERQLADDDALRADLEQQQMIKEAVSQLPRVRAPRHFTLDPLLYGRPSPQLSLRLYPALRVATVLTAFVFVALISIDVFMSEDGIASYSDVNELALFAEKAAEDAEAPVSEEFARSAPLPQLDAGGEMAAAAPAEAVEEPAEEAVAEVVEQGEIILESEAPLAPRQPDGADGEQEASPRVEEPAEETEGVAESDSSVVEQAVEALEAAVGPGTPALPAVQTQVATRAFNYYLSTEVTTTAETELKDDELAALPAAPTPTDLEIPSPSPEMAEIVGDRESDQGILGLVHPSTEEDSGPDIPDSAADVDDDPLLSLSPLLLVEIVLGTAVVLLFLLTLLLRRQAKKGP